VVSNGVMEEVVSLRSSHCKVKRQEELSTVVQLLRGVIRGRVISGEDPRMYSYDAGHEII